jgi:hypothetical protein
MEFRVDVTSTEDRTRWPSRSSWSDTPPTVRQAFEEFHVSPQMKFCGWPIRRDFDYFAEETQQKFVDSPIMRSVLFQLWIQNKALISSVDGIITSSAT